MANNNFIVQNGLTVGPYVVFAGNGDIVTSGNISTTGSGSIASANGFSGLNPSQIYSGTSNVTVTASSIFANISLRKDFIFPLFLFYLNLITSFRLFIGNSFTWQPLR